MNFQDIRKMAMAMDLKTHRIKKTDMILAIQRAESNMDCYGSERVDSCQEQACLWRSDCVTLSNNGEVVHDRRRGGRPGRSDWLSEAHT